MIELTEQEQEEGLIYLALLPDQAEMLDKMLAHRGFTISPPAPKDEESDRDWRILTFTDKAAAMMVEVTEEQREIYSDLVDRAGEE